MDGSSGVWCVDAYEVVVRMRCWRRANSAFVFTLLLIPRVVSCCGVPCAGCKLTRDNAVTIASVLPHATKLEVLECGVSLFYKGNEALGTSGVQTLLNAVPAATMKKISFAGTCGDNVS